MTPPAWPLVPARLQDWVDRVSTLTPALMDPAASSVPLVELLAAALRQAAARGRLDAVQGMDGVWRSSRKAVDQYARSRRRRPDDRSTAAR